MMKDVRVVFSEAVGSVGSVWGGAWNAAVFVPPPGISVFLRGRLVLAAAGIARFSAPPSAYSADVLGETCVHQ